VAFFRFYGVKAQKHRIISTSQSRGKSWIP
jgi:hypothetical protein